METDLWREQWLLLFSLTLRMEPKQTLSMAVCAPEGFDQVLRGELRVA
jgi:hypothetical protein